MDTYVCKSLPTRAGEVEEEGKGGEGRGRDESLVWFGVGRDFLRKKRGGGGHWGLENSSTWMDKVDAVADY